MKRVHIFVYGDIQGVGFRGFIVNVASDFNLKGFVRNLRDGRVEIVFEGERVDDALEIIKTNFNGVEKLDVKEEDFKDEFSDFGVER